MYNIKMKKRGGFGIYSTIPSSSNDPAMLVDDFHPENLEETEFLVEVKKLLDGFKNSDQKYLQFPFLTKRQRYLVHQCAKESDLRCLSSGKDDSRILSVYPMEGHRFFRGGIYTDSFCIKLQDDQTEIFKNHLKKYPITKFDVDKHYESPSSAGHLNRNHGNSLIGHDSMLIPPLPNDCDSKRFRESLPAFKQRREIIEKVHNHRVLLVTGGTGCGKTTQVPQFLLEEAAENQRPIRIVCTQPRRLPAIAVAERVSKERGECLGSTVGYHIRLEQKTSPETVLTYCTSGVLLRMLTVDSNATNISHIILDEIHEREQNTDYLLIALREALKQRKDLKVILMSATMEGNRETFMNYFQKSNIGAVDIPSRLFDVEKYFLDDVLAMTGYITSGNADTAGFKVDNWDCEVLSNLGYSGNQFGHSIHPSASTPTFSSNILMDLSQQHGKPYNRQTSAVQMWTSEGYPYMNNWANGTQIYENAASKADKIIGNRPTYFQPKFAERIKKLDFPREPLVEMYQAQIPYSNIDINLINHLIIYLLECEIHGSILVFLPGYDDICSVRTNLIETTNAMTIKPRIYTLHSQMNSADQQKVFEYVPSNSGERKVILSTNIAEASLTIDDVVFVIDCGKVKEKMYDHLSRISELRLVSIAKSNAEQRSGRAGRSRHGYCFRLYSKNEYESMNQTQIPEMKRSAIHDVCLHAKMFAPNQMSVKQFLEMAPEPPESDAIDNSMRFLQQLGALFYFSGSSPFGAYVDTPSYIRIDETEPDLTELGTIIAHLPLDPQLARMLLYGVALKCYYPIVTLVASLSHRDPFILPLGEERMLALLARDEFGRVDYSDHLMLIRAFYKYVSTLQRQKQQICKQYYMAAPSMKMIEGIRVQLTFELKRLKLIPDNARIEDLELNQYSSSWPMIQAAIVAGCYPGIGIAKCQSRIKKIRTSTDPNAVLHPGSVLKRQLQGSRRHESLMKYGDNPEPLIDFMAFQELSQIDEGITLRTVTATTPIHVVLFSGSSRMEKVIIRDFEVCSEEFEYTDFEADCRFERDFTVQVDQFLSFRGEYEKMKLLMKMRFNIHNYMMNWLRRPSIAFEEKTKDLLKCLNEVLTIEHLNCQYSKVEDLIMKKTTSDFRPKPQNGSLMIINPFAPENNRNQAVENNFSNQNQGCNNQNSVKNVVVQQPVQQQPKRKHEDRPLYINKFYSREKEKEERETRKLVEESIAIATGEDETDEPPSPVINGPTTDTEIATAQLNGLLKQMQKDGQSKMVVTNGNSSTTIKSSVENNAPTKIIVPETNLEKIEQKQKVEMENKYSRYKSSFGSSDVRKSEEFRRQMNGTGNGEYFGSGHQHFNRFSQSRRNETVGRFQNNGSNGQYSTDHGNETRRNFDKNNYGEDYGGNGRRDYRQNDRPNNNRNFETNHGNGRSFDDERYLSGRNRENGHGQNDNGTNFERNQERNGQSSTKSGCDRNYRRGRTFTNKNRP